MPSLNARSLFTQQQMGTRWQHWEEKGGDERNWPPYLTCLRLRISVLFNKHSPTYESIRDYLYFYLLVNQTLQIRGFGQGQHRGRARGFSALNRQRMVAPVGRLLAVLVHCRQHFHPPLEAASLESGVKAR